MPSEHSWCDVGGELLPCGVRVVGVRPRHAIEFMLLHGEGVALQQSSTAAITASRTQGRWSVSMRAPCARTSRRNVGGATSLAVKAYLHLLGVYCLLWLELLFRRRPHSHQHLPYAVRPGVHNSSVNGPCYPMRRGAHRNQNPALIGEVELSFATAVCERKCSPGGIIFRPLNFGP